MSIRTRTRFIKRYIRANAIRKGLLGRDKFWLGIFVLSLLGRQVNKVLKRGDAPIVLSEKLKPGETMIISHLPEAGRRRR